MKQRLILLLLALLSTFGVWAETYTVNIVDGTQDPCGTLNTRSNDKTTLTSLAASGYAGVVTTAGVFDQATWFNTRCLAINPSAAKTAEKVTITAPAGYKITGYSIECFTVSTAYCPYLISFAEEYSGASLPGSKTTYNVTDLWSSSTYFWIYANAATVSNWLGVSSFIVYLADESGAPLVNVTYELYDGNTKVNSVTLKQEVNSDVNIPSNLISGYSSVAYDEFTTEGTIGTTDTTIRVNINKKAGLVEALGDLSNNKAYLIKCERGSYTTVAGNLANTVKKSDYAVNNFAIIAKEGKYYLWSVAEAKFVSCDAAKLGSVPVPVTMTKVANGLFKFQGNGNTMNATSGFDTGGAFNNWSTTDAGNSCAIFEAADFDPTDVLATIELFLNTKSINLTVNVTGATEAENTRVGKITMVLRDETLKKYIYADSQEKNLQYLDATFTATATSYPGYEFTGFTVGETNYGTSIEIGELAEVADGATLVANYTASKGNGLVLWDDYTDDNNASYRIPALIRTQSGRLIAFSDFRPGKLDVGEGACSIERRYSDDNGETWSAALRVAQGDWGTNTSNVIEWGYGDAAVVADNTPGNSGNDVLMICCGGNAKWASSTYNPDVTQKQQGCVRWRSGDGGATWGSYNYIMPDLMQAFVDAGIRAADGCSGVVRAFFSSGKITQSVRKAEGALYNRIYSAIVVNGGDVVVYSDDFGDTWTVLGSQIANSGDEAHVIELPDGSVLLLGRGNSSRYVNVYNYTDFNTAAGQWGATGQWNNAVATACNGDVDVVEAYDAYGDKNTVVLQTAPMYGGQRRDVQYYYIALPKAKDFAVTDFSTVGGASWTQGMNVSHNWSAYSALVNNGDGTFDILFEECAKDETQNPLGYCIVYQNGHSIQDITNGQFYFTKAQAMTDGVKTPRPGHFYRIKGSASNAYMTGTSPVTTIAATDATTIWYFAPEGLVSYSAGQYLDGSAKSLANVGTSYKAAIEPSSYHDGKYTIKTNGYYSYDKETNNTLDRGSSLGNDKRYAWVVEDVTVLPVSISDAGYATLFTPVALEIPKDVTAYIAEDKGNYLSLTAIEGDIIPANTGVILAGAAGSYNFNVTTTEETISNNSLTGTVAKINRPENSYILATGTQGVAFYKDGVDKIPAFKAYLAAETGGEVKAFRFEENETSLTPTLSKGEGVIYDLSGRKVNSKFKIQNSKLRAGIYIQNGKKILR